MTKNAFRDKRKIIQFIEDNKGKNGLYWIGAKGLTLTSGKSNVVAGYYVDRIGRLWPNLTFYSGLNERDRCDKAKESKPYPKAWFDLIGSGKFTEHGISLQDEKGIDLFDDRRYPLAEVERERSLNIRRNEQHLQSIGLGPAAVRSMRDEVSAQNQAAEGSRKNSRAAAKNDSQSPLRVSSRLKKLHGKLV